MITFSPDDYSRFFRDVHRAATAISVYIDRKRELLFVPEFKRESSPFTIPSEYFCRLSSPYTEELIGQHFWRVWEEYKNHPEISAADAHRLTPFYKTVTGGKGQRAFASGRWTLKAQFITSENEIYFTYLYKKQGTRFGLDSSDPVISRILPMQASFKEIGTTVLEIFKEAKIL